MRESPSPHPAVVALVAHARDVPATERERFAAELRNQPGSRPFLLDTCHRVEAYLVAPGDHPPEPEPSLPPGGRRLVGDEAIRHAIAVAVGRDSVVIGEDQILHQLREAVAGARAAGTLHPILERLLVLSLRAGRRARSWRQEPARSLADVALAVIERRSGPIRGREVLVVGAGKMGRVAVRAAVRAGASVSVANRSHETAEMVAAAAGARVAALDPGPAIDRFAGVVVALGGPWNIGPEAGERLAAAPTVVVDLSVPSAVSLALAQRLGARFVSADQLATTAEPIEADDASIVRLDALIDATAAEFRAWLDLREGRAAAEALIVRAERERDAELDALWRRLPNLDADTRGAIERMSEHLARRLLREPLERLGRDADGRHEQAARELFGL